MTNEGGVVGVTRFWMAAFAVAVVSGVAFVAGCSASGSSQAVRFLVSPATGIDDVSLSGSLSGLSASAVVSIKLQARDAGGATWSSAATFQATAQGRVSLGQVPTSGSYTGSDPMGLVLSMQPPVSTGDTEFVAPKVGYSLEFTASVDGHQVATAQAQRTQPVLHDQPLRPSTDGIYGELLTPSIKNSNSVRPGVLVLGGSGGGIAGSEFVGSLIAAAGYPTLALAYFGEPGLPQQLENIPLEYVDRALSVLRQQPGVDPHHVIVYGGSRGGELALLTAATYPDDVDGVIAAVPSSDVNGAYPGPGNAWTLGGEPVPEAPIQVEDIRGPLLLSCGTLDTVWTSCTYVSQIETRLTADHFAYPVTTLKLADAGHLDSALTCCLPDTAGGGTTTGNALAQPQGIAALLKYLTAQ